MERVALTTVNCQFRIEIVAPHEVAEQILVYLRREISRDDAVTACVEIVEVLGPEKF